MSARQRGVRVPAGVYAKGVVQFLRQRVGVCIKGGVRVYAKQLVQLCRRGIGVKGICRVSWAYGVRVCHRALGGGLFPLGV